MRKAAIEEINNPHASQYGKQIDEWNKCMLNELGSYASFDAEDPRVKQAMQKCAELAPPDAEYIHPASLAGKLVEVLTTPCFHLSVAGIDQKDDPDKIPEYFFRGLFDAGISGETDSAGRDIKSRLTIGLYYNGDPVELVKNWTTESTVTTVSSQYNRMFDNPGAVIRKDIPIDNLLADFERRPVTCRIEAGEKTGLGPGEEAEVRITDFRDEKGRNPKYFSRIIVEVRQGRIRGGARLISDPASNKIRAFRLDQLPVTFTYEAPDDGNASTDKIIVYSSCQILDPGKVSMEYTKPDNKIAEKELNIIRPDLIADYSSILEELTLDNDVDLLISFKSEIRASYTLINVSARKDEGTVTESYRQVSSSLRSFTGFGRTFYQQAGGDCVTTYRGSAKASGGRIHQTTKVLRITYDAKSGEVKKVDPETFNIECEMDGSLEVTQKCSKPPETTTVSTPWPLRYIPKSVQMMVTDDPEFQKAAGNRNSGIITGGGEKTMGPYRLTATYTIRKTGKQ